MFALTKEYARQNLYTKDFWCREDKAGQHAEPSMITAYVSAVEDHTGKVLPDDTQLYQDATKEAKEQ